MASISEKVWTYKTFSELSPKAAEQAIKDDTLFSTKTSWGQSMDPNLVDTLFYEDGRPARITASERASRFPRPLVAV